MATDTFPLLTGFESTFPPHWDGNHCILSQTNHLQRPLHDLELVRNCGIKWLRYPAPWHRIEQEQGRYDWRWLDRVLGYMESSGLNPILDPLHHTSHPKWLEGGFANPLFPRVYDEFVRKLVERYPWIEWYTVFNEPLATTLFCGLEGVWYPKQNSHESFVAMVRNVGQAICKTTATILEINPRAKFMYNDTCEYMQAPDGNEDSVDYANHLNERRFLFDKLVLGRIDDRSTLWPYLLKYGFTHADIDWFLKHQARIDIRGLDLYAGHQHDFYQSWHRCPSDTPRDLVSVAMDYFEELGLPIMFAETNIRGYIFDRITWLKYTVEQAEWLFKKLGSKHFCGYCWFPFVDSTDWGNQILRHRTGEIDPVGIVYLDKKRKTRHLSELYDLYAGLARHRITSKDVPAYRFQPPLDKALAGYIRQMSYEWVDPRS